MEWLWIVPLSVIAFAFMVAQHDPLGHKRLKRIQGKRRNLLANESLEDTYKRLQRADYTIKTGAGSICGPLPGIKSKDDADRVLAKMLKNAEDA